MLRSGGKALAEARADFVRVKRALARADRCSARMTIRTDSADATAGGRGRARASCSSRATSCCSSAISAPGKTAFAQGLARGLGVDEPVTSPTFTIVQEYEGRVPLAHVDVYRLDRVQDLYDLGFDELVDDDRVTVVEWGDLVEQLRAGRALGRADRARRGR